MIALLISKFHINYQINKMIERSDPLCSNLTPVIIPVIKQILGLANIRYCLSYATQFLTVIVFFPAKVCQWNALPDHSFITNCRKAAVSQHVCSLPSLTSIKEKEEEIHGLSAGYKPIAQRTAQNIETLTVVKLATKSLITENYPYS